ncbi:hypothetical protein MAR_031705 [Mya arenaria]|uniref:Epidermal growth factor receptor-like transmembrane-juxtamembrane segment domain-containing protein n=1 Tax=Mya arenaria TaxID=6604 RepID=A0ABY7FCU8_MYAAR|nr:hypothetical protein MAR_031705 [Mya arenaria]
MVLFKATCASCSGRCQCCVTDRCEDYKGEDQVCVDGCKDDCTPCEQSCLANTCEQPNGICTYGCRERYWGHNCNNSCHPTCKTCLRENGICSQCVNNSLTSVGNYCARTCSDTCVNKECDVMTGRCLRGCVRNFYADMCDIECPATTTCKPESSSYGGIIGGTVGGAIAMFCVIAAIHIVLFLRRRRQKKRNSSERNRELTLHSPDPYAIEPEMQYQELSVKRLSENQDETYTDLQEATTLT